MTDTSPEAISRRLREVSRLSDLRPERRLDSKIDLSPEGVASRLREASDLYTLSLQLAELGASHHPRG